jgi:hypothetical protein
MTTTSEVAAIALTTAVLVAFVIARTRSAARLEEEGGAARTSWLERARAWIAWRVEQALDWLLDREVNWWSGEGDFLGTRTARTKRVVELRPLELAPIGRPRISPRESEAYHRGRDYVRDLDLRERVVLRLRHGHAGEPPRTIARVAALTGLSLEGARSAMYRGCYRLRRATDEGERRKREAEERKEIMS